jgi:hypothetical protein
MYTALNSNKLANNLPSIGLQGMEEARGGGLIAFTLEANIVVFFLGGGRERERWTKCARGGREKGF